MTRKPHARHAEKRIGHAAVEGDPWAAAIRKAIYGAYHPWQVEAADDPARLWDVLVGRGGGKTTLFKGRYIVEMAEKTEGKFIYACPTLGLAIKLLWNPLKRTCAELGMVPGVDTTWMEAPREGGKILTFNRTGSTLTLFGADDKKQINLCRGQPFDGVGCDEVGFWPSPEVVREFVEEVIEPRIGERDGWIGLASSPGKVPRGYFYDVTSDGSPKHRPYSKRKEFDEEQRRINPEYQGWEGFSSHSWNLAAVTGIVREGDKPRKGAVERYPALVALRRSHLRKKRAKGWSDDNPIWQREYEGRWAADNTTTVYRFEAAKNLWAPQRFDPRTDTWKMDGDLPAIDGLLLLRRAVAALPNGMEWHYVLAADKGNPRVQAKDADGDDTERIGDPYAINVFAFAPADPEHRIFHVYFVEKTGLYARRIAQLLLGEDPNGVNECMPHDKPGGIFGIIGWPDGMVFDADTATIEELSNVYGLRFEKPDKRPDYKFGSVELTNSELVEARVKIIEDSPLHRQITGLQWAEQTSGALKEDPSQPNHSTDCLLYGREVIAKLFESGVVADERGGGGRSGAPAQTSTYRDPQGLDDDPGADLFDLLPIETFDELGRF